MSNEKIKCRLCTHQDHILVEHLLKKHSLQPIEYLAKYPADPPPLWSAYGLSKLQIHNKVKAAKKVPRPRRVVEMRELFPDFGKSRGVEVAGEYRVFDTTGPLTPELDPLYVFPEEQTLHTMAVLEKPKRNRVYLKGFSGTGKTTLAFNLAAVCSAEVMEWNADAFQQRSTLIGHWTVKDGETVWQPGILPLAMERGVWLVINEIDTIDPNTLNLFKPTLEDPPRLTILENGAEPIIAHPDFRTIATANTWARGDDTGAFVNTHTQSDADVRRWNARIALNYMEAAQEEEMLRRALPDLEAPHIAKFVTVANRVREAHARRTIDKTFSPAELINWAENCQVLGLSALDSARISFLNDLAPDIQHAIGEMVTAVFGSEKEEESAS
jgi:cobaltochelatase CobS